MNEGSFVDENRSPRLTSALPAMMMQASRPMIALSRFGLRYSQARAANASSASASASTSPPWDIRVLYDGECPLCVKEINFLRGRDKAKKIDFVDIASPSYSPSDNAGIDYDRAMRKIHGITSDGQVIEGVQVFRRLYEAVGLGFVYSIVQVKPFGDLAEALYNIWAKYRMEVTGREALDVILAKRSHTTNQMCKPKEQA